MSSLIGFTLTTDSLLRKTNITSVSEKRQEEEESQNLSRAGGPLTQSITGKGL